MCLCVTLCHTSAVLWSADPADCMPWCSFVWYNAENQLSPSADERETLLSLNNRRLGLRHKCQPSLHISNRAGVLCVAGRVGDGHPAWVTCRVFEKKRKKKNQEYQNQYDWKSSLLINVILGEDAKLSNFALKFANSVCSVFLNNRVIFSLFRWPHLHKKKHFYIWETGDLVIGFKMIHLISPHISCLTFSWSIPRRGVRRKTSHPP